jgi:hypothetical protein
MKSLAIIFLGERKESRQYFFARPSAFSCKRMRACLWPTAGSPFPLLKPDSDPQWPVYVDSRHRLDVSIAQIAAIRRRLGETGQIDSKRAFPVGSRGVIGGR